MLFCRLILLGFFLFLITSLKANPPDSLKRGIFKVGREWNYKVRFIKKGSVKDYGTVALKIPNTPPVTNQFSTLWKINLNSNEDTVFHRDYMLIDHKVYDEAKYKHDATDSKASGSQDTIKKNEMRQIWDQLRENAKDSSFEEKEELFKYLNKGVQEKTGKEVKGSQDIEVFPNYYWLKPPRTGKLAFTQVAPFLSAPFYRLKHLKDTTLIRMGTMYVTNPPIYEGMVSSKHHFINKEDVKTPYKTLEDTYYIEAMSDSDLGEHHLNYHLHPKFGFVKMVYEKPDGTLVKFELDGVKGFK